MRNEIEIPKAKNVYIAALLEWDSELNSQSWNIHLINDREDDISGVLVMSRGKNKDQKTSTLRHDLGVIPSKSSFKIELIIEQLFEFTNEYIVTFFANNKLHEGSFIFDPNTISEEKIHKIPVMELEGILAKS